jgi:hypothetical protein
MTEGRLGRDGLEREGDNEEVPRQPRLQGWQYLPLCPLLSVTPSVPIRHLLVPAAPFLLEFRALHSSMQTLHGQDSTVWD